RRATYASRARIATHDLPKRLAGQRLAARVGKDDSSLTELGCLRPCVEVFTQVVERDVTDGDQAALRPLAEGGDDPALEVQIFEGQMDQFADTQTGGVGQAQHGSIA